jgi:hypothetical protein
MPSSGLTAARDRLLSAPRHSAATLGNLSPHRCRDISCRLFFSRQIPRLPRQNCLQADVSPRERIVRLVKSQGILRPQDLKEIDVPREYLRRLRDEGVLEQPARGLYVLANSKPTEHQSLVEVCKRVPQGMICLISALQFHEFTTQLAHEVWIALPLKAWAPTFDSPPRRAPAKSLHNEIGILQQRARRRHQSMLLRKATRLQVRDAELSAVANGNGREPGATG